ncbi:SRPBCC family protein [Flavobacterium phycosphaerae]|uniref:SRPBCC family protein n=1 Tax=Flavobacterium phycosphaerae TaxID=2697515 RepID=UPI00138AF803|nr:SRPBCC domain-containing protein [Flavobacterium phycosphaerae]
MELSKEKFILTREIKADKETVFKAFSEAEALAQWWGPAGMPITEMTLSFEPNGKFHYKLEGNNQVMWGLFVYKKISSPDVIEYVSSFADEKGNVCKSPFPIDFPLEVYNQLTFEEHNGITKLTLKAHPINATEEQVTAFVDLTASMEQGFSGTFKQLEAYLSKK